MSVTFKTNFDDYNIKIKNANMLELKKIFVAIAGPMVNILIAIFFYYVPLFPNLNSSIIYANVLIAFFNLLPIYPLDGRANFKRYFTY